MEKYKINLPNPPYTRNGSVLTKGDIADLSQEIEKTSRPRIQRFQEHHVFKPTNTDSFTDTEGQKYIQETFNCSCGAGYTTRTPLALINNGIMEELHV